MDGFIFILFSLCLIASGFVFLFKKETVWKLTKFSNSIKGVKSERTTAWEDATALQGILFVIVGCIIIGFMFYQVSAERQRKEEAMRMMEQTIKGLEVQIQSGDTSQRQPEEKRK